MLISLLVCAERTQQLIIVVDLVDLNELRKKDVLYTQTVDM